MLKNMSKYMSCVGMFIGIVIIVFSVIVFCYDAEISSPLLSNYTGARPNYELDKAYGGDAYTGMQQASAQAANNLIPVFDAVENMNENVKTQIRTEVNNTRKIISSVQLFVGFLLLSIGLLTTFKYAQEFLGSLKMNLETASGEGAVAVLESDSETVSEPNSDTECSQEFESEMRDLAE